jgi:hypothetical protein
MATLVSPGVSVTVVDESAYASPGTGTIPFIAIATRSDKADPTGTETDGIAKYTKLANAGQVVPVTSQRELTQFFGDPIFTAAEGSETSEYGLLAAYSFLGQGAQAYVVRANVDLADLIHSATAPTGAVAGGTYWLDTNASKYGVHEWNGTSWGLQSVTVEVDTAATAGEVAGTYTPSATVVNGDYLVAVLSDGATDTSIHYFKGVGGAWEALNSSSTGTATFAPHYSAPSSPTTGDAWIKTTTPGNGINLAIYSASAAGVFGSENVATIDDTQGGGGNNIKQDGTSVAAQTLVNSDIHLSLFAAATGGLTIDNVVAGAAAPITTSNFFAQDAEPTGNPANGALWFNNTRTDLDVLVRGNGAWERIAEANIQYSVTEPTENKAGGALTAGDIWVDTGAVERSRPALYQWNGSAHVLHDNTDQTTQDGVIFADFTDQTRVALASGAITAITGAPDYQLYPAGMLAINMGMSKNTVRSWNSTAGAWRNAAANHADGSGAFGRLAQRKVVTTAMQAAVAGNEDLRDPMRNFTLLASPGYPEMTDELVTLNSDRGETGFIIIDTPMRKTPTQATAWVQGVGASENGEDGLVTKNTYSAAYYPAGRSTTPAGVTVTVPPSHMALYQYAYNDNISYQWFAPAGLTRGVVQNASAVGYITTEEEFKAVALTQGQRDSMYSNKMNPIATYPSEGVVFWGQKSLHSTTSALDRVNVARLVAYLRERFDEISRPFLFEPNDTPTRARITSVFEGFMSDILAKRGVTDFAIVCDESNNTAARIDRNELYVDVAIAPTKSTEFIYIPIRIVNTGTLS